MLGIDRPLQNASKLNLQQIQQFLHSSEEIRCKGKGRAEIYAWVARTLRTATAARTASPKGCCGSIWSR